MHIRQKKILEIPLFFQIRLLLYLNGGFVSVIVWETISLHQPNIQKSF